jgi:hypothetical protein
MQNVKPTKPPVIRRGQRVPYHRGSQREIDERRGHIARMLARGVRKMDIHALVRAMFRREWRTTDRDIAFITGQASQWRERVRSGYGRISLYEALVKMKLIKDDAQKDGSK